MRMELSDKTVMKCRNGLAVCQRARREPVRRLTTSTIQTRDSASLPPGATRYPLIRTQMRASIFQPRHFPI